MFYHKKPIENLIPVNSPAWLERRAWDDEINRNNRLPRRLRRKINVELAFS
jgi:hypothetical protein